MLQQLTLLTPNLLTRKAIPSKHLLSMINMQGMCHQAIIRPRNLKLISHNPLSKSNRICHLNRKPLIRMPSVRSRRATEKILRCKSSKEKSRSNRNSSKKNRLMRSSGQLNNYMDSPHVLKMALSISQVCRSHQFNAGSFRLAHNLLNLVVPTL